VEEELLARVNYCHLLGHVCSHDYLHALEGLRQVVRVIAVSWLRELDFRALELCGVFDFGSLSSLSSLSGCLFLGGEDGVYAFGGLDVRFDLRSPSSSAIWKSDKNIKLK
jgi:hypothetical protein